MQSINGIKQCSGCRLILPAISANYGKDSASADGLHKYCKRCKSVQSHKWATSAAGRASRAARILLGQEFIMQLLNSTSCQHCGESDPVVLRFDHLLPSTKEYDICWMVSHAFPTSSIQAEVDKCQVLCANCHQRKTAHWNNNYKIRLRKEWKI